jgi:hypothetical protein
LPDDAGPSRATTRPDAEPEPELDPDELAELEEVTRRGYPLVLGLRSNVPRDHIDQISTPFSLPD